MWNGSCVRFYLRPRPFLHIGKYALKLVPTIPMRRHRVLLLSVGTLLILFCSSEWPAFHRPGRLTYWTSPHSWQVASLPLHACYHLRPLALLGFPHSCQAAPKPRRRPLRGALPSSGFGTESFWKGEEWLEEELPPFPFISKNHFTRSHHSPPTTRLPRPLVTAAPLLKRKAPLLSQQETPPVGSWVRWQNTGHLWAFPSHLVWQDIQIWNWAFSQEVHGLPSEKGHFRSQISKHRRCSLLPHGCCFQVSPTDRGGNEGVDTRKYTCTRHFSWDKTLPSSYHSNEGL